MKTNSSEEPVATVFKAAASAVALTVDEKKAIQLSIETQMGLEFASPENEERQTHSAPSSGSVLVVLIIIFIGAVFR